MIANARQQFLAEGSVDERAVTEAIARSWQRCIVSGLDDTAPRTSDVLTAAELQQRLVQHQLLLQHAEPEMVTLTEQISHTQSLVILTDQEGLILRSMGDRALLHTAQDVGLLPGASWSESSRGTNAIGTAIAEKAAIAVQGAEHFMAYHHALSCAAVPIFTAQNHLLATLDVSNRLMASQQHTLALVKMAAQMIENRLFRASQKADWVLHFHARPEFIGTLWEGVAMMTEAGDVIAMNRSGQFQLGDAVQRSMTLGHSIRFESLFDLSLTHLKHLLKQTDGELVAVRLLNGARLYVRVELLKTTGQPSVAQLTSKRTSAASLDMLNSGDPQMALAISQTKQVMGRDIPVLIQGETGAGKELFARAIHEAGPRATGPWVAVNCAALPEGLIEAELFGYEEGAFTGAKRKGSKGKIEQADGGTLFLDEIGDMPLSLQARLLRVLQERAVTPLGSTQSKSVEFSLVSATNLKLKDKVLSGEFRSDLYYRLNGLSVQLPALRERTDLRALVAMILEVEQASHCLVSAEVFAIFEDHPWPGNIRQLHNVLRTALALADGGVVGKEHLTRDFLDELSNNQEGGITAKPAVEIAHPIGKMPLAQEVSAHRLDTMTASHIQKAMQRHQGNVSAVARELGISRNTLYRRLREMNLA